MTDTYVVAIAFYVVGTEKHLTGVNHATPPRIGEKVWLSWTDDDAANRTGCFRVVDLAWSYTSPLSHNGVRGLMGGMVDVMVEPAEGLFR